MWDVIRIIKNFATPIFIFIGAIFGFFSGKTSKENDQLNQENQSLRQLQKRRAKRDSDSDAAITSRLRADARKE